MSEIKKIGKGLIIAAPRSGAGKTTVMLGLCKAFTERGIKVQPYKNGPDYIDPAFHKVATGHNSCNLDSWAMNRAEIINQLISSKGDLILFEGSMGLFDGVSDVGSFGTGTTADIARLTGWPVILVLDASGQAQSAAAVAKGFYTFDSDVKIAGVILNNVSSLRHKRLLEDGMSRAGIKVLGCLPRNKELMLPERHLGLIQAEEISDLNSIMTNLSQFMSKNCNLDEIIKCANSLKAEHSLGNVISVKPPGQRIAMARDKAFAFIYPHLIDSWRNQGAEILYFSPLKNETPNPNADIVWLPGGYPELYAGRISSADKFLDGLRHFSLSKPVHGECGGYMVMGEGLIDAKGCNHKMAGILGLVSSFKDRKMKLGYRRAQMNENILSFSKNDIISGHEFHYSSIVSQPDVPLAEITDANNEKVSETGSRRNFASGTFFHVIARMI